MNKHAALQRIAKEIEQCKSCKKNTIGMAVVGEGNPDAEIAFIGEAPGKTEAKTGRPFVGRSGKLLRSFIAEVGLKDEEIYITSPVKYLPKRGTPTPADIAHGRVHLNEQLGIIDPRIIVLLGRVAVQGILQQKIAVMKEHGNIIKKNDKYYFITIHPAAGLRFPPLRKIIIEDFKKLKKLISSEKII